MTTTTKNIVLLLSFFALQNQMACAAEPYVVSVAGIRGAEGVEYRYSVLNLSGAPAMQVTLGVKPHAQYPGEDKTQLATVPIGFSYGECGEVGCAYHVPESSVTYPQDWSFSITTIEDQTGHKIIELSTENEEPYALSRNEGLAFSVKLPRPDITYANSGFKIEWGYIGSYKPGQYYGQIKADDITAPVLDVVLTPTISTTANGEWLEVAASWTVSDDKDAAPDVLLENIECLTPAVIRRREKRTAEGLNWGEVPGGTCNPDIQDAKFDSPDKMFKLARKLLEPDSARVYLVTYVAYDAIGNKTVRKLPITITAN